MRLTSDKRAALVRAIMGDIPKTDYTTAIENMIKTTAADLLPAEVRSLPKDTFKRFIVQEPFYGRDDEGHRICDGIYLKGDTELFRELKRLLSANTGFRELIRLKSKQAHQRLEIERKVTVAVGSCTTDKQLTDRYPEFAKYLPTKNEISNLPTVPIIEHLRAAGWKG